MKPKQIEVECFGGPADGMKIPVPDFMNSGPMRACMTHIDKDDKPHFYTIMEKNGVQNFVYAGDTPDGIVKLLEEVDPETAHAVRLLLESGGHEDIGWTAPEQE